MYFWQIIKSFWIYSVQSNFWDFSIFSTRPKNAASLDFTIALLSLKSEIPTVLTKYFSFDSQLLSNEGAKRKATAEVQKHKFKTFSMAKSRLMSREVSLRLEIQKHLRGDILH